MMLETARSHFLHVISLSWSIVIFSTLLVTSICGWSRATERQQGACEMVHLSFICHMAGPVRGEHGDISVSKNAFASTKRALKCHLRFVFVSSWYDESNVSQIDIAWRLYLLVTRPSLGPTMAVPCSTPSWFIVNWSLMKINSVKLESRFSFKKINVDILSAKWWDSVSLQSINYLNLGDAYKHL